jgi:hypothetical protein
MTGHKEGSHKAKKEPRMAPKKRKRVVTPDETHPTKKLSRANAKKLRSARLFPLRDDGKPNKTYGCPYNVKKLAINGFAPISYAARKAPNKVLACSWKIIPLGPTSCAARHSISCSWP